MNICLRAYRTIAVGHRPLCYRPYRRPHVAKYFTFFRKQPETVPTPSDNPTADNYSDDVSLGRAPYVTPEWEGENAAWIESLEQYLPQALGGKVGDIGKYGVIEGNQEVQSVLRLLEDARKSDNVDILAHLAFKLKRWDAVHYVVNRLLDGIKDPGPHPDPKCLPSNLNWRQLGIQNWDSIGYLDQISRRPLNKMPQYIPVSRTDSQSIINLVEPRNHERPSHSTRNEILGEIWQSLGAFVLEAADLTERRSLAAMEHVFQILGRLQHLDLIPHDVYNDASSGGAVQSRSRAGTPYFQTQIMNVLADASLQAIYTEATSSSVPVDLRPPRRRYKVLRRELGAGMWLEFVLYCCIEGGFSREAHWIVDQMQHRSNEWHVKSWNALLETVGEIDPKRIDYFDTWAECGQNVSENKMFMSRRPFLGLGERTISSEVMVSIMDGLIDSATIQHHKGFSVRETLKRIDSLRSTLERSGLRLGNGDVNYVLARLVDSQAVVAEDDPHSLEMLLDLTPFVRAETDSAETAGPKVSAVDHGHGASTLVLGLHSYAVQEYALQGNVSGMLSVFETFIGALDFRKILEMRRLGLDKKYRINESPVRSTEDLQKRLFGEEKFDDLHYELVCSFLSWPISLSLFIDTIKTSRNYRLGKWLLDATNDQGRFIPTEHLSHKMIAPALLRYAAATSDRALFSNITNMLKLPASRETLKALTTYQVGVMNWDVTVGLLEYQAMRHDCTWGATNVAAVAAAIIQLDQPSGPVVNSLSKADRKAHMGRAKDVLVRLFEGEYNRSVDPGKIYLWQEQQLYQLHRLLSTVPGALEGICRSVKLQWKGPHNPPGGISTDAFNLLLAAVVDAQGSLAGKRLWTRWCMDPFSDRARRIKIGPNASYLIKKDPSLSARDRKFIRQASGKASHNNREDEIVLPDINTVRILAMGAIKEQNEPWKADSSSDDGVLKLLAWCAHMFKCFGLTGLETDRELEGNLARILWESSSLS